LACAGTVTSEQDAAPKPPESRRLDVLIDLDKQMATIDGNWGCTLVAVQLLTCGSIPFRVSVLDDRIAFAGANENDSFSASASLTVMRASLAMRTHGSMMNKLPDRQWLLFSTTGEFQCEVRSRQF
jgi:hypothetical protein